MVAIVAGIVAVLAFRVASRQAVLSASLDFLGKDPAHEVAWLLREPPRPDWPYGTAVPRPVHLMPLELQSLGVMIRNDGSATATNVVCWVSFRGLTAIGCDQGSTPSGRRWIPVAVDPPAATMTVVWEGGTNFAVHPKTPPRPTEPLMPVHPWAVPGASIEIKLTVAADGSDPYESEWVAVPIQERAA